MNMFDHKVKRLIEDHAWYLSLFINKTEPISNNNYKYAIKVIKSMAKKYGVEDINLSLKLYASSGTSDGYLFIKVVHGMTGCTVDDYLKKIKNNKTRTKR